MVTFPLIELQFTTICLSLSTVKTDTACSQIHTHTHFTESNMLHTNLSNMSSNGAMSSMACQQPSIPSITPLQCGLRLYKQARSQTWKQLITMHWMLRKKINSQGSENKSHTKPNVSTKNQKISITKHRWFMAITRHHRWCLDRMGPKWTTLSSVLLLRHY